MSKFRRRNPGWDTARYGTPKCTSNSEMESGNVFESLIEFDVCVGPRYTVHGT